MKVIPINKSIADIFVRQKHYSHSPSIFWKGFGLVIDDKIEGVVVYGQPSPSIQKHAFKDRDFRLYELSRLVIQTKIKNAASYLIGNSLKMLETPCGVVSYADTEFGHCGIVYQSTNWVYTGAVKGHDKQYLVDGRWVHGMTIKDLYGCTNQVSYAKEHGILTRNQSVKHRYFYICGNRYQKKEMLGKLIYSQEPYPKCEKTMYDCGENLNVYAETDIFDL